MDERLTPERTRREGVGAFLVHLADGNAWGLALPSLRLSPRVIEGVDRLGRGITRIEVGTKFGYPLEISQLIDDLRLACQESPAQPQYEALIRLVAALILRVHNISLVDALGLLELDADEIPRLVEVVLSVVTGESLEVVVSSRKAASDG